MVEEQTQQESKGSLTKKGKKRSRPVDPSADPPADPPADPSAVIKKAGKTSAEQNDVAEGGRPTKPNNREVKRREESGALSDPEVSADFDDQWTRGLEELRRKFPHAAARRSSEGAERAEKIPDSEEYVRRIREAITGGDWTGVLSPPHFRNLQQLKPAVRELHVPEAEALLSACAERLGSFGEVDLCAAWISAILEQFGNDLIGRPEIQEILGPLLEKLTRSLGRSRFSSSTRICLGKWRLVSEIAQQRKT